MRNAQRNFLSRKFDVQAVGSAQEAMREVEGSGYDLLLCEVNVALEGFGLANMVRSFDPKLKIALIGKGGVDRAFSELRRLRIHHFLIRTAPLDYDEFEIAVENAVFPEHSFGLGRYFRRGSEVREAVISSRDERKNTAEAMLKYFEQFRGESELAEIRLAFEELINNAVYHSFRLGDGREKYKAGAFEAFERGETVAVEYGSDSRFIGFSVTDNQGTLDVDTVMAKMERQISLEGLMDMTGRGMYLTRSLADRMIVNLEPRRATQIILLFMNRHDAQAKPLYINVVSN